MPRDAEIGNLASYFSPYDTPYDAPYDTNEKPCCVSDQIVSTMRANK